MPENYFENLPNDVIEKHIIAQLPPTALLSFAKTSKNNYLHAVSTETQSRLKLVTSKPATSNRLSDITVKRQSEFSSVFICYLQDNYLQDIFANGDNQWGQLGVGHTKNQNTFTKVVGLPKDSQAVNIYALDKATFIEFADGRFFATGYNQYGQLGSGNYDNQNTFVEIIGLPADSRPIDIYTKNDYIFIKYASGKLFAAGYNTSGQLGIGHTSNQDTFIEVVGLPADSQVIDLYLQGTYTFILLATGQLFATGCNYLGQLSLGHTRNQRTFVEVAGLAANNHVVAIFAQDNCLFIKLANNELLATGSNDHGELGVGHIEEQNTFVRVIGLPANSQVANVYSKNAYTFIKLSNDELYVTGYNGYGQLGLGHTHIQDTFIKVTGLPVNSQVIDVYVQSGHTFIKLANGKLLAAGRNNYGQLGIGHTHNQSIFVEVMGLPTDSQMVDVYTDDNYTFIRLANGKLLAAGKNHYGQLGIGHTYNQSIFVEIMGLPADCQIANVYLQNNYTFIILTSGKLLATGLNNKGQLGLGHTQNQNTFTEVPLKGIRLSNKLLNQFEQELKSIEFKAEIDRKLINAIGRLDTADANQAKFQASLKALQALLKAEVDTIRTNISEFDPTTNPFKPFADAARDIDKLTEQLLSSKFTPTEKLEALSHFEQQLHTLPFSQTKPGQPSAQSIIVSFALACIGLVLGAALGAVAMSAIYALVTAPAGGIGALPGFLHGAVQGGITGWSLGLMAATAISGVAGGSVSAYAGYRFFKPKLIDTKVAQVIARKSFNPT